MKKTLIFLFSILQVYFFSQNLKVTYDYKLRQGDSIISQNVTLYNEGNISFFFSNAKYETDSILSEREKKEIETGQRMSFKNLPNDEVVYFLKKQNDEGFVEFYSNEFDQNLEYKENNTFDWKLSNDETKKYLSYTLKKATLKKYGKDFIAWYCPEVPINDGPYKFFGLPGLIFEMYDTNNTHHFTLNSIQKTTIDTNLLYRKQKFLLVSKEKYVSFREQFKKDPFQKIKSMISNSGMNEYKGKNGNTINMSQVIAEREKKVIAKYKLDNQIE